MLGSLVTQAFCGFGPSAILPRSGRLAQFNVSPDRRAVRRLLREQCPLRPGIYGMLDAEGTLIYVGKSKCLRHRLLSYFTSSAEHTKGDSIIEQTARLVWEPARHEFAALVRELEMIRRWRPRFNVRGQPGRRRFVYVCLGRRPAPYVYLASQPAAKGDDTFGPLRATESLRDAIRVLNDTLQLRMCPERVVRRYADQASLFGGESRAACLRYDLGLCLGPCAALCTAQQYAARVAAARQFLDGRDTSLVARLETEMQAAAAAQNYEGAALLRDRHLLLVALDDPLAALRTARREYSFVYRMPCRGRRDLLCLLRGGQPVTAVLAPRDKAGAKRLTALLEVIYGDPSVVPEDAEMIALSVGWFRAHPEELVQTCSPAEAKRRWMLKFLALRFPKT